MRKKLLIPIALAICASQIAFAGEQAVAIKNDLLKAEPFVDAKVSGQMNRGDNVEILAKKGAWLQVKASRYTGWVRILSVKRNTSASAGTQVAGVLDAASGRSGTGQVVSTTGVRGLSAEDLKTAKFNEQQMNKLESFSQSSENAKAFAEKSGLKPTPFKYLSAPESKGGK